MRRFISTVTVGLAPLLALAGTSSAAVWELRGSIADGRPVDRYDVSVAPTGGAAVAWSHTEVKRLDDSPSGERRYMVMPTGAGFTSRAEVASPFAPARALGSDEAGAAQVSAGEDGVARLEWSELGTPPYERKAAVAQLGEAPGPATTVDADLSGDNPWRYYSSRGTTLQATCSYESPLTVAYRPAGGSYGSSHELSSGGACASAVDFLPDGRAVVLWVEASRVNLAICDAAGCEEQVVSDAAHPLGVFAPRLAIGRGGDIAVVWPLSGYPWSNKSALAVKPAGEDFEATRLITDEDKVGDAHPAVDARGNVFVAWNDGLDLVGRFVPVGGEPGPREVVPTGGLEGFDVGFDARGNLVAAFTRDSSVEHALLASERLPDGTWTNPQLIASLPTEGGGVAQEDPRVRFDATGTGLAVWRPLPEKDLVEADYDGSELTGAPRVTQANARLVKRKGVRVGYRLSRRARVSIALAHFKCSQVKGRRVCRPGRAFVRASLVAHRGSNRRLLKLRGRHAHLSSGRYQATITARRHSVRVARGARFRVR